MWWWGWGEEAADKDEDFVLNNGHRENACSTDWFGIVLRKKGTEIAG